MKKLGNRNRKQMDFRSSREWLQWDSNKVAPHGSITENGEGWDSSASPQNDRIGKISAYAGMTGSGELGDIPIFEWLLTYFLESCTIASTNDSPKNSFRRITNAPLVCEKFRWVSGFLLGLVRSKIKTKFSFCPNDASTRFLSYWVSSRVRFKVNKYIKH